MSVLESGIGHERNFPRTSWSMLLALKNPDSPDYERRLKGLIQVYWKPVFCVIQYNWAKNVSDAKDMTQAFFTEAVLQGSLLKSFTPELGSFRTFLRRAVTYFMCNAKRGAGRTKRGGDLTFISLDDADEASLLVEDSQMLAPDELFDLAWNRVVLAHALDVLRERLEAQGKGAVYQLFERYELEEERKTSSYAEIGREFDMSPSQVKHALMNVRSVFRDVVTEVVHDYVDSADSGALNRELDLLFR